MMSSRQEEDELKKQLNRNRNRISSCLSKSDIPIIIEGIKANEWFTPRAIEEIEAEYENKGKSKAMSKIIDEFMCRSRRLPNFCKFLWREDMIDAAQLIDVDARYQQGRTCILEGVSSTTEEASYMATSKPTATNEDAAGAVGFQSPERDEKTMEYEFSNIILELNKYFTTNGNLDRLKTYLKMNFPDIFSFRDEEKTQTYIELERIMRKREIYFFKKPDIIRKLVNSPVIEADERPRFIELLDNYERRLR